MSVLSKVIKVKKEGNKMAKEPVVIEPITIPPDLVYKVAIYLWFKGKGLSLEEIDFILNTPSIR